MSERVANAAAEDGFTMSKFEEGDGGERRWLLVKCAQTEKPEGAARSQVIWSNNFEN